MSLNREFGKRFYTDFYDSVNQRRWIKQCFKKNYSEQDLRKIFLGRLRLDVLLSETLILTDSQILDGMFFLYQDPRDFLSSLVRDRSAPLPIEIRSRRPRLEDSFLSFVKKGNQENLKGFSFSCIADESTRVNIQTILENTRSERVSTWKDVISIIKSEYGQSFNMDSLDNGWNKWIEAQDSMLSRRVIEWNRSGFCLDDCLNGPGLIELMKTEEGKEEARQAIKHKDRSLIDRRITELIQSIENLTLKEDLRMLETGFNYAYNFAISRHHSCKTFESFNGSPQARRSSLRLIDSTTPQLAKFEGTLDTVLGLGEMPLDVFQSFFKRSEPSFHDWWEKSDHDALRRGFEPFLEFIYQNQPSQKLVKIFGESLSEIAGLAVTGLGSAVFKAVCQIYIIDRIVEKVLPTQDHMANRIIEYATSREDLAEWDYSAKEKSLSDMSGVRKAVRISNKIETIEEDLVYSDSENRWVKLYFDKVRFPGGKEGRYNRIVEGNDSPGVVILPICNEMICLVRQYRYPIQQFSWELPRGFGDSKDSLQEAVRELYEETGISVSLEVDSDEYDHSYLDLGIIHPNSGLLSSEVRVFAVICPNYQVETFPQDPEVNEKRWFSVQEIQQKIRFSQITDSFTLAAILRADLLGLI